MLQKESEESYAEDYRRTFQFEQRHVWGLWGRVEFAVSKFSVTQSSLHCKTVLSITKQ